MTALIAVLAIVGIAAIAFPAFSARSAFGSVRVAVELVPLSAGATVPAPTPTPEPVAATIAAAATNGAPVGTASLPELREEERETVIDDEELRARASVRDIVASVDDSLATEHALVPPEDERVGDEAPAERTPALFARFARAFKDFVVRFRTDKTHDEFVQERDSNSTDTTLLDSLYGEKETGEMDDNSLASGLMPLDAASAADAEVAPTASEVETTVRAALRSGDASQISQVAEIYNDHEELRPIVSAALHEEHPDPDLVIPLALGMLRGPIADQQLGASLLFSVGMVDEASMAFRNDDPATRTLLAATAISAWGEEKTRTWLSMHLPSDAVEAAIVDARQIITAAENHRA